MVKQFNFRKKTKKEDIKFDGSKEFGEFQLQIIHLKKVFSTNLPNFEYI